MKIRNLVDDLQSFVFVEGIEAPSLPEYVLVGCGDQWKSMTFFEDNLERKGWVPIYGRIRFGKDCHCASFGPGPWGRLKVRLFMVALLSSLGDVEKSHSLTYTAFLELHDCLALE
jgi:hypothetical protein